MSRMQTAAHGRTTTPAAFAAHAPAARAVTLGQSPAQPPAPPTEPAPLSRRIAKWTMRASVISIAASLLVHLFFLLFAAVIFFQGAQAGGAGDGDGEMEFAIITEAELQQLQAAALEVDTPTVPDTLTEVPQGPPMEGPSGENLPGAESDIGGIAEALRGTGDGLDDGSGLGAGGTGGGAASFFGVEAKGSRFAYIVDVSGSMRGEPLGALKVELNESIQSLLEHMTFFVSFFASDAFGIGGRSKWIEASDSGKQFALDEIRKIDAQGGTNPLPGFEMVFRMSPRPDAIYFMTDGLFDESVVNDIARLNRSGKRVVIHCITFLDNSSEKMMREIAEQSGGSYNHIMGPR
jgi:hypothetical protein